ncbi:unnamed protein product [Effrenium voratum]|uniref:Uncharacterized protein n=1 Tax=Effrenium voratum TaxID=2562239 RepID=A0AA36J2S0_9DINO|nr:unnamed protein product [Effrenium voratum]
MLRLLRLSHCQFLVESRLLVPDLNDGKQLAASACNELRECQREVKTEGGKLVIDISRLVSNKKIANKKLEFTFDLQSGVTVYTAKSHELALHCGTPWLKDMFVATNHPELIYIDVKWHRSKSGKQRVKIQLSYNPRKLGKYFMLSIHEILDDPEFGLLLPPDARFLLDGPPMPCTQQGWSWRLGLCGKLPTAMLQLDTWQPEVSHAQIFLRYARNMTLFPPRVLDFEVQYKDPLSGQHSVVIAATQQNCSLPTCKGKAGEHFDAGGFCPKCRNQSSHHFCKRRCVKEAAEYCSRVKSSDSEVGFFAVPPTAMTGAEFIWGRLKTYMGLEATDFFREELMTRDVISAIARNCDYHTGLLDIVAKWLSSAAFTSAFRDILAHAAQNPMMSSWDLQETLLAILLPARMLHSHHHDDWQKVSGSRNALERALPFSMVTSIQSLRPWTYAVCRVADRYHELQRRLHFWLLVELLVELQEAEDDAEAQSIQTTLEMIQRCVLLAKKENRPQLKPSKCGKVLARAPNEQAFRSVLVFCSSGRVTMKRGADKTHETVLHVAAARNFGDTLNMILQKRPAHCKKPLLDQLPDVNSAAAFVEEQAVNHFKLALTHSTALHIACESGCYSCVESLLVANASVSPKTDAYAVREQAEQDDFVSENLRDYLFTEEDKVPDYAFSMVSGLRPIHLAAMHGCDACLERLLHHGEDGDLSGVRSCDTKLHSLKSDVNVVTNAETDYNWSGADISVLPKEFAGIGEEAYGGSQVVMKEVQGNIIQQSGMRKVNFSMMGKPVNFMEISMVGNPNPMCRASPTQRLEMRWSGDGLQFGTSKVIAEICSVETEDAEHEERWNTVELDGFWMIENVVGDRTELGHLVPREADELGWSDEEVGIGDEKMMKERSRTQAMEKRMDLEAKMQTELVHKRDARKEVISFDFGYTYVDDYGNERSSEEVKDAGMAAGLATPVEDSAEKRMATEEPHETELYKMALVAAAANLAPKSADAGHFRSAQSAVVMKAAACHFAHKAMLVCFGLFMELASSASEALFADSIPAGERAGLYVTKSVITTVGSACGPGSSAIGLAILGDEWELYEIKTMMVVGFLFMIPACFPLFVFKDPKQEPHASPCPDADTANEATAVPVRSELRLGCLGARHVPVLLALADFITCIGAGMTVKFFNLFFIQDLHFSPVGINLLQTAYPLVIAGFMKLTERLAKPLGRPQASLLFFSSSVLSLWIMAEVKWLPLLLLVFMARGGFANSTYPIDRSILMDFTKSSERGFWPLGRA